METRTDLELLGVGVAGGVEGDDEEGEEERHHVGVGDDPSFVVFGLFGFGGALAHAASRRASAWSSFLPRAEGVEEAFELFADDAGVIAGLDGHEAFDDDVEGVEFVLGVVLELVGEGEPEVTLAVKTP
ncbi:hypothetical protein O0235_09290 [Tepidiforma flava]|uniref:Uncharacterized protein n=1 Tax=Tepidiforma flava TaxID=3004094 RepID=A0ABY7M2V4_9CHLR|nr:hypothetical protein [Tepidiforma flava]WBL34985.1 hypothetical protein O0235_09290 [Tepidiforma flava]